MLLFVNSLFLANVQLYEYRDGDDTKLAGRIIALYNTDGTIAETLSNPVRVAD